MNKMPLILFYVGSLLCLTLQWQHVEGSTVFENKTLLIGDKLTLASPDFPRCCASDFKFFMNCTWANCGLKILFLDVDLPNTATLTVFKDASAGAEVLARARHVNGVWTRPSLVQNANTAAIVLTVPSQHVYPEYVGVKVQVNAISTLGPPATADLTTAEQCGQATLSRWKGGEIKVVPGEKIATMDCIWVLRKPAQSPDVNAFVRFTYTKDLHGVLAVRNGSSTAAPAIFYFDTAEGSTPIMHGREGFTSPGDLFVRLRKDAQSGHLTFVYGLFERMESTQARGDTCIIDGRQGFYCATSKWCIPIVDRCDGVKQCPRGEDERDCDGVEIVTYSIPTTTVITTTTTSQKPTTTTEMRAKPTPCPYGTIPCADGSCAIGTLCPGECWSFEKKCPDDSCVSKYSTCPGECKLYEKKCPKNVCVSISGVCPGECRSGKKKCPNGNCISSSKYCRGESCPSYSPHRCGDQCYDDGQKCDGNRYCNDGSDEENCGFNFPWYIILILVGVAVVIFCILCAKRKGETQEVQAGQPAAVAGAATRPAPLIAGARGPRGSSDRVANTTYPSYNTTVDPARAPLAVDPSAPPSYTEAMETPYVPPTAPVIEPTPPPYDEIAATNMPPKDTVPV